MTTYDALVIGGGAAGLAGATALARSRRSVLVVDAGSPRNAPAAGVHQLLGHDGIAPGELLARGRAEVTSYGGEVRSGTAVSATGAADDFTVVLADGTELHARRLLVTTGLVDELPDVPGLAEHWGTGVLHCPYCHGWEVRDQRLVVLASSPMAVHQALLWSQMSGEVTLVLHDQPAPDDEQARLLANRGVRVLPGHVDRVAEEDGRLTGLVVDGEVLPADAVVTGGFLRARSDLLESLGLESVPVEMGGHVIGTQVPADPTGLTAVPGVYVAGNVAVPNAQVATSAAAGMMAGAMINAELVMAEAASGAAPTRRG